MIACVSVGVNTRACAHLLDAATRTQAPPHNRQYKQAHAHFRRSTNALMREHTHVLRVSPVEHNAHERGAVGLLHQPQRR